MPSRGRKYRPETAPTAVGGGIGWLAAGGLAGALADVPPPALVVGGIAFVVVAFVAREVASGALREVGKNWWEWAKRRTVR